MRSAAEPVSELRELALMAPEVRPSRLLRREAAREVSVRVRASLPSPLMPVEV